MANYNYSYFDNNDENCDMDNLDKMAREINDKKNKNNLIKNVHNNFLQEEKKNKRQLKEMLNNENFRYFSAQGNIDNNNTVLVNNSYENTCNDANNDSNNNSNNNSNNDSKNDSNNDFNNNFNNNFNNDTNNDFNNNFNNNFNNDSNNDFNNDSNNDSNNDCNDSFLKSLNKYQKNNIKNNIKNKIKNKIKNNKDQDDNLSLLINNLKKEHNSHIFSESESISSISNESIIKHLKNCKKCKSKIQLVFDDNHKIKYDKENIIFNSIPNSLVIKLSDLKEYMVVFLLIILILLVIYIFFKLK